MSKGQCFARGIIAQQAVVYTQRFKKNGNPLTGQGSLKILVVAKYRQVRQPLHTDNLFLMLGWSTCYYPFPMSFT